MSFNRILTAFKPFNDRLRGAFDVVDERGVAVTIKQFAVEHGEMPARVTVGPSVPQALVLRTLQNLTDRPHVPLGAGQRWVVLHADRHTHRIVEQQYSSMWEAADSLQVGFAKFDRSALVNAGVLDLLDEASRQQLNRFLAPKQSPKVQDTMEEAENEQGLLEARKQMLKDVATLTSDDLARLRVSTTSNVSQLAKDLRQARKIFGVRYGKAWYYPQFQFTEKAEPLPEIERVLRALGEKATGWDLLQWFLEPNSELEDATPLKTWDRNKAAVVRAAEQAHWFELG